MKKKLENFFYYYKFHVLAAVVILFIIWILLSEKNTDVPKFLIVDDTSALNLEISDKLLADFASQTDLDKNDVDFQYRKMFLEKKDFQDISFDIAGIEDYEDCFLDGTIDIIICTADNVREESMVMPEEYFTKDELKKYEKYFYYEGEKAVGIIFDMCEKAEEYFGEEYPSDLHYILQITQGSKEDKYVKQFLEYLMG